MLNLLLLPVGLAHALAGPDESGPSHSRTSQAQRPPPSLLCFPHLRSLGEQTRVHSMPRRGRARTDASAGNRVGSRVPGLLFVPLPKFSPSRVPQCISPDTCWIAFLPKRQTEVEESNAQKTRTFGGCRRVHIVVCLVTM